MDAARYQKIKRILLKAGEFRDAERAAYLEGACRDDDALRREVEELLAADTVRTGEIFDPHVVLSHEEAPTELPPLRAMPEECAGYRIEREIGRGGMGIVFAARAPDDTRVAIKVVEGHLARSPAYVDRFKREAEAGRKVNHKNVVRTMDVLEVEHEGRPLHLMVMEFVVGQSLRGLLQSMKTVPEGLLREVARQAAAGLAAIHAAGVVHRDLKPENILITDDEIIQIMDLGVAKLVDVSVALTNEGQFIGSLPYAPPEQCRGQPVTALSDLYSLGVVLYELAIGSNPFRKDNPAAALRAHLQTVPTPLAELPVDITPFFSSVLATLLEKSPAERFESAAQLADVLAAGETSGWWRRRRGARTPRRRRLRIRRDTKLYGREDDLARLGKLWLSARGGDGRVVWLGGEPGLGKTRLIDAFLHDHVELEDTHVLYGSFPPHGGHRGLVDALTARFPSAELAAVLEPFLGPMAGTAPALHAFLRGESPVPGIAALTGETLQAVFRQLLRGLANDRPLVWVVDDFHFASRSARRIVHTMARAAARARALLIITSRPGCEGDQGTVRGLEHGAEIVLERLSTEAMNALMRESLGNDHLLDELAGRIAHKSDGVPFFLLETIRGLEERGYLKRLPDGSATRAREIDDIEVPSAVRDLIAARLSGLSRDERALVDVAAVVGYEFDADWVAAVLERPLLGVLQDLAELERTWNVVRASGRGYRFDHHQFQETVYRDLAPALREEYHARLADAHRRRLGDAAPAGPDAVALAWHGLHGSRPQDVMDALQPAMETMVSRYAGERLITLADRALALGLDDAARVDVLLRQASGLEVLGRRDRQRQAVGRAVDLAGQLGEPGLLMRAHRAYGTYCWNVGHASQALDAFDRELKLARAHGDEPLELTAMMNRAVALGRVGRFPEAVEHYVEIYDRAHAMNDRGIEGKCVGNWAMALVAMGRFATALEVMETKRVDSGDVRSNAHVASCLGLIYWHIGRFREAQVQFDEQYESATSIGDRRSQGIALGNMGLVHRDLGELEQSLVALQRQIQLSREIGDLTGEANGHLNLGLVYRLLGDEDHVHSCIHRANEAGRVAQHHAVLGHSMLLEADLAADRNQFREALDRLAEARALFARVADESALAAADFVAGRVAIEHGELDAARTYFDRADQTSAAPGLELFRVRTRVFRSLLPDALWEDAAAELEEWSAQFGVCERAELLFTLFRASGKREFLDAAHRALMTAHKNAPPALRELMLTQPRVHRAIVEAVAAATK